MSPFSARITYTAPASEVAAMLADPAYVERKVAASKPVSSAVDVQGAADGAFTVTTQRALATDDLPSAVQNLIGRTIEIRLTEAWDASDADGSRNGTIQLEVLGKPASASGTVRLAAVGPSETVLTYEGSVEARVPLVGRKIEQQAVQQVQSVLNVEQAVGSAWLAEH
ncbi:DUF2505 domain-containing protein [Pseudactinotalea suaedae]|jgi:hypothetical protein|uniref:DUF2505 domain-containing protein n=1 Tax=Pseudactinotalea suaedae TaxID=1524924 RepID=UPI0012E14054|nr:DUF2505 domain-containing protein [Pseudactinotalea suaedae]